MPTLPQALPPGFFVIAEANTARSRENWPVSLGKKLRIGEVAKSEQAVDLTTTANTHSNTVLDTLAATTRLVVGDIYGITGAGIPAGTTFTYGGSSAGTLSQAATASGVSVHITRDFGVGPWLVAGDLAAGISIYDVDATDKVKWGSFIARQAAVNLKMLIFPNPDDDDALSAVISDLAAIGIICRD
jgi:Bacteriophage lambda head decoration protein D